MILSARFARSVPWNAHLARLFFIGAFASARLHAQAVVVRDAGPGPVGRRLATALAGPHQLISPGPGRTLLSRDSAYAQTVIVLQRDAVIEGQVHGDVIVVGGDAFLHPGATVDGRVVAIGGAVYGSHLAIVRGGVESHRDFTFATTQTSTGYALTYQTIRVQRFSPFSLPGLYGVRVPAYDRVDGLSLPFGPLITFDTGSYEVEPVITYRSNLGVFDPSVNGNVTLGRRTSVNVFLGRATSTNEDWIWSDLVNSAAVLGLGLDTRNYYRIDRVEATLHRLFEGVTISFDPYIGARAERDRSVARDSLAEHVPWSFFGRTEGDRMRRPNPAIESGALSSVLLGAHAEWDDQRIHAALDLTNEGASFDVNSLKFVQSTLDLEIRFPTFGRQEFYLNSHVVHTFGDKAPPQRWSYLGGSGTIPTLGLLSMGGDQLFYLESNYFIPIQRLELPVLGAPSITLRHLIGSAGVGALPSFEQNLVLRLALSFGRLDIAFDPTRRAWEFSAGLSLAR